MPRGRSGRGGRFLTRQVHGESGLSGLGAHFDLAAVCIHDLTHDEQPQAEAARSVVVLGIREALLEGGQLPVNRSIGSSPAELLTSSPTSDTSPRIVTRIGVSAAPYLSAFETRLRTTGFKRAPSHRP